VTRGRLAPQTGTAFELARGDRLRVIDPLGQQVADCIAFARPDSREWLSSGRTIDYNGSIYLTAGSILYSNRSNPMLTILADTVGRHDFLYTPCSAEMFSILYNTTGHHPSCFENLCDNLKSFGILPDQIPTTFNIFMNVAIAHDGALSVMPPCSKPGDYLEMRADVDLIVGLTACSAELSNNYQFKPIDFEITRD